MVRHPFGILSSMEKAYRKNPEINKQEATTVDWAQMRGTTVNKRIDGWLASQPVGLAFDRLYDAILRGWTNAEDILFVRFEDLTSKPEETMKKVHWYLEIPDYDYDFKNIKQVTEENVLPATDENVSETPKQEATSEAPKEEPKEAAAPEEAESGMATDAGTGSFSISRLGAAQVLRPPNLRSE